jgi:cytochrome c oxidase cbb3-type subunit 4
MIFGIFTAALLLIFLGVATWAYSSRRRADFDDASRLPLQEDTLEIRP